MVRASKRGQGRGGAAGDDHEGGDVPGDDRARGDDGAGAEGDLGLDDRAVADPAVGAQGGAAGGAGGEEGGVVFGVLPVIRGPVQEVVLGGVVKGWSVGPMRVIAAMLEKRPTVVLAMSAKRSQ